MLSILLLVAAMVPTLGCGGDRVCIAANQFRGAYSQWAEIINNLKPGTFDAREPGRWKQVEHAFKRLQNSRKEQ